MENQPYELELVPIKIKGNSIELWTVKKWKEAVEAEYENEAEYFRNFPLWIKIWEASLVLSDHLSRKTIDMTSTILELGAGMGLTGIALGSMGYSVTITDYNDDALAILKKNVAHNKLKNVRVRKLDWFHPHIEEKYNIICGSELIYKEEVINPLISLLQKVLEPDGTAFIAHDINRKSMTPFLKKAESIFQIKSSLKTLKTDNDLYKIAIHTIRFK
ncbi:MAG: protein N-lysine methyltransferase family protein [Desulfobacterales bacterium]|nr:protein N-lysine methyltransferase family protein [Desulfobacterales bacterium]